MLLVRIIDVISNSREVEHEEVTTEGNSHLLFAFGQTLTTAISHR
jgi:hypothetical protein